MKPCSRFQKENVTSDDQRPNNLYLRSLPKELPEKELRQRLAVYGRIKSFKLVDDPKFDTNVAYVAFESHCHADKVFKEQPVGRIFWHTPKSKVPSGVLFDISNQLSRLQQFNLLADPSVLSSAVPTDSQKIDVENLMQLNNLFEKMKNQKKI